VVDAFLYTVIVSSSSITFIPRSLTLIISAWDSDQYRQHLMSETVFSSIKRTLVLRCACVKLALSVPRNGDQSDRLQPSTERSTYIKSTAVYRNYRVKICYK